jgi:hypothetical protein
VLLSLIAASAVAAPGAGAAAKDPATAVRCSLRTYAIAPQSSLGTANCKGVLGRGTERDAATITRSSPTSGTLVGTFKLFFDRGTIGGTYRLRFAPATAPAGGLAYTGTLRVTRGSADFRSVRGRGDISGGGAADMLKLRLRYDLRLTELPASDPFAEFCRRNPGACG